ncbi:MAG: hypothetical protein J7L43_03020 [Candidatus Aenigmarchaeota archaeon]|nr:hypothetical protein [Candidatus Aenigmarchaeota archaeon]
MSKPKDILKEIVISHIKNRYGEIGIQKKGAKEFWTFDDKVFKPYLSTNRVSFDFNSAVSEKMVESVMNLNASFLCFHYRAADIKHFRAYCVHPETLIKHYIDAQIPHRKGSNRWRLRIKYDNNNLVLIRQDNPDVRIPIDDNNYCIRFEMTDDEYERINPLVPIKKRGQVETKKTLKVVVKGEKGSNEFSITSAKVIAILSILSKSTKPLTREEILEGIIQYGVLTRGNDEIDAIKRALKKLLSTGGIVASDRKYSVHDKMRVKVIV